ncbi:MAG TPA: DUF4384 domain-containing protein [Desulfobacterales bacterium]|nr:DUF4384 domain-containing protein [Desulfobacterales bacterium]
MPAQTIVKLAVSSVSWILVLQFAFLVPLPLAQDVTWVTVEGTAPMEDISKEEARTRSVEDATRRAVEKVVGANISAETLIVNLRLSGSILGAIPYGRVVDRKIVEEGVVNIHDEKHDGSSVVYKVKMKAAVAEETTGADPDFKLQASLNRSSFNDGDEMVIRIKPKKDCHVSVFTILEDEKIVRLIPNQLKPDNSLKANETFFFPDENDKGKGLRLRVHTPEGKDAVTETIYVLGLKQPIDFNAGKFQEGIYGIYNGQTAFMNDLIKEIVGIPLSERAEQLMPYQITAKRK